MELRGQTVLLLGGWGLVGSAIVRALVDQGPARVVLHSLRREEAEEAVRSHARRFPEGVELVPVWGNVFVRWELRELDRSGLQADRRHRRWIEGAIRSAVRNAFAIHTGMRNELPYTPDQ